MVSNSNRRRANLALGAANFIFGAGNVVSKIGLTGLNPILFALIREAVSGPLLVAIAHWLEPNVRLDRRDWWRFVLTGLGLFATNFCYIVGVKLAGATAAAIWQPAQPIFICAFAIFLKYERATKMKLSGILIAAGGCLFVSLYGQGLDFSGEQSWGNVIFFIQCIACAGFYISEKPLLERYPPITTVGYAYLVASCLMAVTASAVNTVPAVLDFVCDDCHGQGWDVPSSAWVAIAYWVFAGSIMGYLLNTWGNQYVDASLLGAYAVLQPIVTVAVSSVVIVSFPNGGPKNNSWGLKGPDVNDFGVFGIIAGLMLVVYDNKLNQPELEPRKSDLGEYLLPSESEDE
jgi:drug/metabolite transporter (DMT)-like permease